MVLDDTSGRSQIPLLPLVLPLAPSPSLPTPMRTGHSSGTAGGPRNRPPAACPQWLRLPRSGCPVEEEREGRRRGWLG